MLLATSMSVMDAEKRDFVHFELTAGLSDIMEPHFCLFVDGIRTIYSDVKYL